MECNSHYYANNLSSTLVEELGSRVFYNKGKFLRDDNHLHATAAARSERLTIAKSLDFGLGQYPFKYDQMKEKMYRMC